MQQSRRGIPVRWASGSRNGTAPLKPTVGTATESRERGGAGEAMGPSLGRRHTLITSAKPFCALEARHAAREHRSVGPEFGVTPGLIRSPMQGALAGPAAPGRVGADQSEFRRQPRRTTWRSRHGDRFTFFTLGRWACGLWSAA